MMKDTHIKGGIVAGLAISCIGLSAIPTINTIELNNTISSVILLSGSVVGSLAPDLDHKNSFAGRRLWFISGFLNMMTKIFNFFNLKKLAKLSGHRGLMHSVLYWLLISAFFFLVPDYIISNIDNFPVSQLAMDIYKIFIFGVFIGALSHIVLDMMTVSGVPIFLPISYKTKRIPLYITSNSKGEKFLSGILIVVIIAMIAYNLFGINVIAFGVESIQELTS